MSKIIKKICLIGPEGVGKTSLIRRYVDNSFDEKYISTIGVSLSNKIITINEDQSLEIILWDLEGFTSGKLHFPPSYLNGASGFVFVCDITNESTFKDSQKICSELYERFENKNCFSLAINKTDLISSNFDFKGKEKDIRKIFEPCLPKNIYFTSAKSDKNISSLFETLGENLVNYDVPNFRA